MAGVGTDGASAPPSTAPPPTPATSVPAPPFDMTSISFRDQLWLNTYPLDRALVFDYFALSPFYENTCNNEQLRMRSIHPLDMSHLTKMTGVEYILHETQEPHLFIFRKQRRDGPEKQRSLYHISKAYKIAASKLEKIGYDIESETQNIDGGSQEEGKKVVDDKEAMRIDQIMTSIFRKLPPAPPAPAYPPPSMPVPVGMSQSPADIMSVANPPESNRIERVAAGRLVGSDQGPAKRVKLEL